MSRSDIIDLLRGKARAFSHRAPELALVALVAVPAGCARVDPESELAAAAKSFAARNYAETAIRLGNVVQARPDNAEARKLRGELALAIGDYAAAVEDLEKARALGVAPDTVALGLADAKTSLGQWQGALDVLDSARAALDREPLYWILRAVALVRAGRTVEAEQALDACDRAGDGGTRAAIARAQLAFARNDTSAAATLLDRALQAKPDDPLLLTTRAELFARTDRLIEAAADYQRAADLFRAASLDQREVAALLALLQVQLARNDLDGAEKVAARLTERAPGSALTEYSSGLVDYRSGRFDEAAAQIQPLVNAAPDNVQFRALLGAIQLARGNLFQAEQQFLAVLTASPRDPAAIKLLAETRLRQQRPEAALSALRPVENSAAEDPQIGLLSGLASLQSGDTERGLLYLQQAASLDPSNELLKLQLARAYIATGRDADASRLLETTFGGAPAALEAGILRLFATQRTGDAATDDSAAAAFLKGFPREPRALTAAAIYFQSRGDNRRAHDLFEQAAGLETTGTTARLFLAASLVQDGRSPDAERLLQKVIDQQPDDVHALVALAELRAGRGALDDAAQLLNRAAEHSTSVTPRLSLAQLRIRQGDLPGAKTQVDLAAQTDPNSPEVTAVRGVLALAEGRAEDAAVLLENAASELPNRLGVTLALARAQLAAGSPEQARATLRKTLAVAPQSPPLRLALGEAELQLGHASDASSIAAALKADFPTQSGGYLLEADALIARRRYAAAADSLAAAFEREATWRIAARRVQALVLAGRRQEAEAAARDWAAANPKHIPAKLLLAGLMEQAARNEEALSAYESVLSLDPNNVPALNNAAWLSHVLKRPGALKLAERAHALDANNPAVLDTFGWILLAEKREPESIAQLSRAAQLAPDSPEISYHFAKALAAGGRSDEARSVLIALLNGERNFEQRADAQRLLESL
jgi:putative PEP-CTERM system TPR-repeat lipoprotein